MQDQKDPVVAGNSVRTTVEPATAALLGDIRSLIETVRQRVAAAVNAEMVMLYWRIGERIRWDILGQERAEYGKRIVQTLSGQLTAEYGQGFTRSNLFYMIRFAEVFPDEKIVHSLSGQLSWTHLRQIIYVQNVVEVDQ